MSAFGCVNNTIRLRSGAYFDLADPKIDQFAFADKYEEIERRVEAVIQDKFCVSFEDHLDAIRKIDHEMLIAERRSMFSMDQVEWAGEREVRKVNVTFQHYQPREAEERFTWQAMLLRLRVATAGAGP